MRLLDDARHGARGFEAGRLLHGDAPARGDGGFEDPERRVGEEFPREDAVCEVPGFLVGEVGEAGAEGGVEADEGGGEVVAFDKDGEAGGEEEVEGRGEGV